MPHGDYTATYSPDDNKLRLYAVSRLDPETYAKVRAYGFIWAAKQGLFVAPKWTPDREDLLIELCGEVDDEDTSLTERAEQRADRFEDYRDKRADDAERTQSAVSAIADNIPFGQPILVGHHSERHARKDAERIENGMRKTLKLWKTSQYWAARAKGAIGHAKYKELPAVRARRIKTIEAEKRGRERTRTNAVDQLALWNRDRDRIDAGTMVLTLDRALAITNSGACGLSGCFPLAEYPRVAPASQYEGQMSYWSALKDGVITPIQARDRAACAYNHTIARCDRWITHYEHRLTYERAMLDEQGGSELLAPKPKSSKALLPLCNYRAADGLTIGNIYHRGELIHYPQVEMTQAAYAQIHTDYKATRVVDHSHRVRTCMQRHSLVCVFLTDSKVHTRPAAIEPALPEPRAVRPYTPHQKTHAEQQIETLREAVKAGVQVVTVPQLFPTPRDVAQQVADLADVQPGHRVLEPSAGTGMLLGALGGRMFGADVKYGRVHAVEINGALCPRLRVDYPLTVIHQGDFLAMSAADFGGTFHRIVMNPPFERGADITHIQHARAMLAPGGRLVAICANGPRQQAALQAEALEWIALEAGTFAGTDVRAAIVVFDAGDGEARAVVDAPAQDGGR